MLLRGRRRRDNANRRDFQMRAALLAIPFAFLVQNASAATATGYAGLALAGVVGAYSPMLNAQEKNQVAQLFNGHQNVAFPKGKKIEVDAAKITCKAGNVDITARSCALTFGARTVNIAGRAAAELYATLIEAGVPSDGAAGTIYENVDTLACAIDPDAIKQNAGEGASCAFVANP
jgi:hypothetical protein